MWSGFIQVYMRLACWQVVMFLELKQPSNLYWPIWDVKCWHVNMLTCLHIPLPRFMSHNSRPLMCQHANPIVNKNYPLTLLDQFVTCTVPTYQHANVPTHPPSMAYISRPLKCKHTYMPTHFPIHVLHFQTSKMLTWWHTNMPTCLHACRDFLGLVIFNVMLFSPNPRWLNWLEIVQSFTIFTKSISMDENKWPYLKKHDRHCESDCMVMMST